MKRLFYKTCKLFCLLLTLTLSACIFNHEPTSYYILESMPNIEARQTQNKNLDGVTISVLPVELPQYLARMEMVSKQGQVEILIHNFHEWGEDLEKGIARVISSSLSQKLNSLGAVVTPMHLGIVSDYILKIEIISFEGELEHSTKLEARWILQDNEKIIRQEIFSAGLPLANDGKSEKSYDSAEHVALFRDYVTKNSQLLESLAININEFLLPLLRKK